jgi:hypothetical protein
VGDVVVEEEAATTATMAVVLQVAGVNTKIWHRKESELWA